MALLLLLRRQLGWSLAWLIGYAGLAGLAGAATLAILARAAAGVAHEPLARLIGSFCVAVLCFAVMQRHALRATARSVEALLHRMRCDIIDLVMKADLRSLESLGQTIVLSRLEKETKSISMAAITVVNGGQSLLLLLCIVGYIATLSPIALLLCVSVLGFGLVLHFMGSRHLVAAIGATIALEDVAALTSHAVLGAKEIRLHSARRLAVQDQLTSASERTSLMKGTLQARASSHVVLAQLIFYIVIAAVVFALPNLVHLATSTLVQLVTAILFMVGPVANIVAVLPAYAQANASAQSLIVLRERLQDAQHDTNLSTLHAVWQAPETAFNKFETLELQRLGFRYDPADGEGDGFAMPPISFQLRRGEVVFVTGPNGSGKSTFLKLLTALYRADTGQVAVDGVPLQPEGRAAYRALFSTILSGYHLFPKLYGIENPDGAHIDRQLVRLGLSGRTRFENGRFTTTDLSTGQRKRLALLIAQLEERPVLVLDEWAADQDPVFRRWFYREELPRLRALGRTVVAVTHDDQYFDLADRHIRFSEGRCEPAPTISDVQPSHHLLTPSAGDASIAKETT